MSTVNVNKSSPVDYKDNDEAKAARLLPDRAADYRPVEHPRDWRYTAAHYAGVGGLVLLVTLLAGLLYLFNCGIPWTLWGEWSETCETWSGIARQLPFILGGVVVVVGGVELVLHAWRGAVAVQKRQIENARFNNLPDRFGNIAPPNLYHGMTPEQRFDAYYRLLELATNLELNTAKDKWIPPSVNTLTITGPSYKGEVVESEAYETELPPALPAPIGGESILATLRREGLICRSNNSLHIGNAIDGGGPKYLELKYWGMLAHGGVSRTGKTAWTVYQACQAHMMGWSLVVCDKHAYKTDGLLRQIEPLGESFLMPAATTHEQTRRNIMDVARIGEKRLAQLQGNPEAVTSHSPIVIIIDEFTNMVLSEWIDDEIVNALLRIGNEFAGVNIHGIINGHDWSSQVIGKERGAILRRITTHRVAHRMDAKGAEFLLAGGYSRAAEGLRPGELVFVDDEGLVVLTAPLITDDDVAYAAANRAKLAQSRPTMQRQAMNDAVLAAMLGQPVSPLRYATQNGNGHAVAEMPPARSVAERSAPTDGREALVKTMRKQRDGRGKPVMSQDAIRAALAAMGHEIAQDVLVRWCQEADGE